MLTGILNEALFSGYVLTNPIPSAVVHKLTLPVPTVKFPPPRSVIDGNKTVPTNDRCISAALDTRTNK